MEPSLCVVSSWVIKRVYIILIWNTISRSSNLDNCFYHCLVFTLILHLKVILKSSSSSFIIYIVNLLMVRPRFCRVIYYFDTPTLVEKTSIFWSCQVCKCVTMTFLFNLHTFLFIFIIIEVNVFLPITNDFIFINTSSKYSLFILNIKDKLRYYLWNIIKIQNN